MNPPRDIIDEFVRTHVTFRPVKCEARDGRLYWTFAPVVHEHPVVEDTSMYLTGDGEPPKLGTIEASGPPPAGP